MKEEIEINKKSILIVFLMTIVTALFNVYYSHKQDNRLNEHKRLLIAQQDQINQLILNAHKYEKKVK